MSVTYKPFLKWVGGKTQILDNVLELFPKEIVNYHEPFLGGGSVLLGLLSRIKNGTIKVSGKIYASDINRALIGLYQNIQSQPQNLIAELKKITDEFTIITEVKGNKKPKNLQEALTSQESYYYWIRKKFNSIHPHKKNLLSASALFLFLNKTCFRGLYRESKNGFNVPFGKYKNPTIYTEKHILEISKLIQNVHFSNCSFTEASTVFQHGDFLYLDPPYAPESETSFVSYNKEGFDIDDHKSLFKYCNNIHKTHQFLLSNADVPLVKDSFPAPTYSTQIINCRRSINSKKNKKESKTNEVLITNRTTS